MGIFRRSVKFYDKSKVTGNRELFTFRVENENDARAALRRFRVKAGWFNEVDKRTGQQTRNKKIFP